MIKFENIRNLLRKTFKFGVFIPFANIATAYGAGRVSRERLEKINQRKIEKVNAYLSPIVDEVNSSLPALSYTTRRIDNGIWVCWMQGEEAMPPVTRLCLDYIRFNSNGHTVTLLTVENYNDYVTIPDSIIRMYNEGRLKQAHFADIIRINLLAQQGGLWLDSTILVTEPIPEDVFRIPFFSIKSKPFGFFVSRCRWSVFTLAANRNNVLFRKLAEAFRIYLEKTDVFIDYFLFDHFIELLYESDEEVKEMIDAVPMNNLHVHDLDARMCEKFDAEEWKRLTADTYFFKLSNRSHGEQELKANPDSYFRTLESGGLYRG